MKGVPEPVQHYDIRAMHGPFQVRLPESKTRLSPLSQPLPVHLYRIKNKMVTSAVGKARISQLSLMEAQVEFQGELNEWDDVRLHLLDETGEEKPGKIFGKVLLRTGPSEQPDQARVRFTSVSPETYACLRQTIAQNP